MFAFMLMNLYYIDGLKNVKWLNVCLNCLIGYFSLKIGEKNYSITTFVINAF